MKQQNFKNHIRWYAPHHFIFLPMTGIFTVAGAYNYFVAESDNLSWGLFALTSFALLYLALMLRQHYALNNQNRIVRLEFRLRYFELTGQRAKQIEDRLSFGQIAALRFASDEEFLKLTAKLMHENISPTDIKKSITDWQGDYMRV